MQWPSKGLPATEGITTCPSLCAVRLLPPTPLPPGVAIHRAAATAEQKNPDQAVADARARVSEAPVLMSCCVVGVERLASSRKPARAGMQQPALVLPLCSHRPGPRALSTPPLPPLHATPAGRDPQDLRPARPLGPTAAGAAAPGGAGQGGIPAAPLPRGVEPAQRRECVMPRGRSRSGTALHTFGGIVHVLDNTVTSHESQ